MEADDQHDPTAAPVRMSRAGSSSATAGSGRCCACASGRALPTASRRPTPDFLIVGGQRCGTTSLYRYLVQHPSVLFPRLTKGTHWFDEEYHRSEAWYRSNFPLEKVRRRREQETGGAVARRRGVPLLPVPPGGARPHRPAPAGRRR